MDKNRFMAIVALLLAACLITLLSNHYSRNRERGEYERELAELKQRNSELDESLQAAYNDTAKLRDRAARIDGAIGETELIIGEFGKSMEFSGCTIGELRKNQEQINERTRAIIKEYQRLRELIDGFTDSGQ